MSQSSAIEWTDATWNPVTGCDRVSPGCAHCYALDLAARLKRMGQARYQRDGGKSSGPGFGVTLHPDKLGEPLRWRRPRRVFVNSMSDLFHDEIPAEYVWACLDVMRAAERHEFQVLTKRPWRMRQLVNGWYALRSPLGDEPPVPNIWLGVSIENRRFVHRADVLRETHAAVRFISAEPLLGPLVPESSTPSTGVHAWGDSLNRVNRLPGLRLDGIDWLIVGGESGPRYRPLDLDWVRGLRNACLQTRKPCAPLTGPVYVGEHAQRNPDGSISTCERCGGAGTLAETGTAFFFKQVGGRTPKSGGRELDGRTWDEMPRQAVAA